MRVGAIQLLTPERLNSGIYSQRLVKSIQLIGPNDKLRSTVSLAV